MGPEGKIIFLFSSRVRKPKKSLLGIPGESTRNSGTSKNKSTAPANHAGFFTQISAKFPHDQQVHTPRKRTYRFLNYRFHGHGPSFFSGQLPETSLLYSAPLGCDCFNASNVYSDSSQAPHPGSTCNLYLGRYRCGSASFSPRISSTEPTVQAGAHIYLCHSVVIFYYISAQGFF